MKRLTEEQIEDMQSAAKHHGMPHVLSQLDAIIDNIKGNVLSVPLDKDPEKAALTLLQERMKLEGAVALKNAFLQKVNEMRSAK